MFIARMLRRHRALSPGALGSALGKSGQVVVSRLRVEVAHAEGRTRAASRNVTMTCTSAGRSDSTMTAA